MGIKDQYEDIGKDFISQQEETFSKKSDYARIFIKEQLSNLKGKVILDVGCGPGKDIVTYEQLGAEEVYGIDPSKTMINEAKKIVKEPGNVFVGTMEKTPFDNKKFDVIVGRFSIHYIKNLDNTYEEFNRILKPNGILIFTAHHPYLGFMQLGAKDYYKKGIINMQLYKSVKIQFPQHTFKDYFSDKFFQHFSIEYFDEENIKNMEYPNKWNIPGFIMFKAKKR